MLGYVERKNASYAKTFPALYDQKRKNASFSRCAIKFRGERRFSSSFSVLPASLADFLPKC